MDASANRWSDRPQDDLEEALELVRAALGWNWAEIAKRLGRHRQAVHREYARRNREEPTAHRDTA